jgi:hypothetical protein
MIPQFARYGGPFPFFDTLRRYPALYDEPDVVAYILATIPEVRVQDLIHFFMGIFWKASVHPWAEGKTRPWLSLGLHREAVRQFILGQAAFPAQMALSVVVLPPQVTPVAFHFPYATRGPDATYHLYISGINCTLWAGPNIPFPVAAGSVHRPPHHLLVADHAADITKKFREAHQSAMKLKSRPRQ